MPIAHRSKAKWKIAVRCIFQFAPIVLPAAGIYPAFAQDAVALADKEEAALKAATDKVAPSVVQIRTIGGLDVVEGTQLADGPTTGLVISADGYILSSAFNFAQQPASILITFPSGKQAPAELVATDHSRMLVLLKATGVADLPVPTYAPLDEVKPGQWAVAMGRTFRADRPNVTIGIVSALGRMFGKVIQTDADVSTANYGGPLVDIHGRVLGVLVPMAPQGTSEVAGTEWYDSGIGFAVPVASLAERIEHMKKGEDQKAGLLGVALQQKNPHSAAAELAVVRPDSPAGQAGLKKGDRIVEINGNKIRSQTDMRFALGTAYGGDSVQVVVTRGKEKERIERTIKLVGELAAFRHAFLGILPMRPVAEAAPKADDKTPNDGDVKKDDEAKQNEEPSADSDKKADAPSPEAEETKQEEAKRADAGIVVRMIYADSPAAAAGVQRGDRITEINDTKVATIDEAIQVLNNVAAETKVTVRLIRDGKPVDLSLTAGRLPNNVPAELPAAIEPPAAAALDAKATAGETTELKLPEFKHACQVYVPDSHSAGQPLGALLWLPAPGAKTDDIIHEWQKICDRDGIVLIVSTPKDSDHWERTDLEYLHRLLERVVAQYKIDPHRVVVGGQGATGSIAWHLGLASRDMVRGIATSAAPLSRQIKVPPNDPAQRLAVFAAIPPKKDTAAQIAQGLKTVADAGYNVATITTVTTTGQFSDAEREELARWFDSLDRF